MDSEEEEMILPDFEDTIRMMARHDREQDALRYARRLEQQRRRTHKPNRKNKRKVAKASRRQNR